MISIKARSRNQCASMNRVERQSLSLTLVDDILQPMNHHHMASNSANLALLCTPMTSQNAHSAAHHSTQTLLAQRQCIRVALADLQHSSLQACTVEMNPRWSPTRCRHAAFELELGKCNRHDDLSSETIDVDIFSYQLYSIFIKSDVNRVTQHCINVNDTLLVRGAVVDLIESNSRLKRICIRLNYQFE
jgi:hypothetical protein